MPVNTRTMQRTTKEQTTEQLWQNNTRYNMSYERCDVMLRCLPPCEGNPLRYDCYTTHTGKCEKNPVIFFFDPSGGGEGGS